MNLDNNNLNWPAWNNGQFCQVKDVSVSMLDMGLLRSYGIYDGIAIKNSWSLGIDLHLKRFEAGCQYWLLKHPYSTADLLQVITQLNALVACDFMAWVVATRGYSSSYETKDIIKTPPQVAIMTSPYKRINKGMPIRLGMARKVRRIPSTCINQNYKNFARQDFTLAQLETSAKGYDSALLMDHDNFLTEGPAFNVAIIKDSTVLSPAQNRLPGVTMSVVKTLCEKQKIAFEYTNIDESLMLSAEDMFLTSTAGGIVPVASVDNKMFVQSQIQQQIQDAYQQAWTDITLSQNLS